MVARTFGVVAVAAEFETSKIDGSPIKVRFSVSVMVDEIVYLPLFHIRVSAARP